MTDCIFCRIVSKEIPSAIVYEDEEILAFRDISPKAPVHVLIIPKQHLEALDDASSADAGLIGRLNLAANRIAASQGIAKSGYRLLTNCRGDSGQEVFHLHYHLIGGRPLGDFCQNID